MNHDPELHTIRSALRLCEARRRGELETARYSLFVALQGSAWEDAERWAAALRTGLIAARDELGEVYPSALAALARIEATLAEQRADG